MMFNNFLNYLFGTHNEESPQRVDDIIDLCVTSITIDDDWVLIDPIKENSYEPWTITPPICFPYNEPIFMETSPLENLLIAFPNISLGSYVFKEWGQHINFKSISKPKDIEHSQSNSYIAPHNKENECIAIARQETSQTTSCSLNLDNPNKARELCQDEQHQQSSTDCNNN